MSTLAVASEKLATLKAEDKPIPQSLRDEIAAAGHSFVLHIVHRVAARLPPHIDREDLYQAGHLGLLSAIEGFEHDRNCSFRTYAEFRIRGYVIDQLRKDDVVSRSGRDLARRFSEKHRALSQDLGHAPTDEEVLRAINVDEVQWVTHLDRMKRVPQLFDDREVSLDAVEKTPPRKEHGLEPVEWWLTLFALLMSPSFKLAEREVLYEYYVLDLTMREIGELRGVTESRACQIHTEGLQKLRALLRPEKKSGSVASSRSLT